MNNYLIIKTSVPLKNVIKKFKEFDIDIYNIDIIEGNNYLKIRYKDYSKIKKYLHYYNFYIVEYIGNIKMLFLLKKYKVIFLFFISSLLLVFFCSNLIVDIKVIHENEGLANLLYDELEKNGIKKFSFKKSFDNINTIKKNIKNNHLDKIDWLEIEKIGMIYVVRVEERIINLKKDKNNYCHVYAKKSGLIKKIIVYAGEKKVNINDYVKKDDLLISGDVLLNEEVKSKTCASGGVDAEVWYQINITIPFDYEKTVYTGKKRHNLIINYNDIDYKLLNDRLDNYESNKSKIFDLLGIKIYLQTDREIRKEVHTYTEDEIINKAIDLAKEKVKLKIGEKDKIIDEKILQKRVIDSKIDLDMLIIAEEDITYIIPIKEVT